MADEIPKEAFYHKVSRNSMKGKNKHPPRCVSEFPYTHPQIQ